MVCQQRERARKIIAADADLEHADIQGRQRPVVEGFLERYAAGQLGPELFDFSPERTMPHAGRELFEGAFQRDAVAQHGGELLVEKAKFVVVHKFYSVLTAS